MDYFELHYTLKYIHITLTGQLGKKMRIEAKKIIYTLDYYSSNKNNQHTIRSTTLMGTLL